MTIQTPDALRPVSCAHEAYQGQCAHCGVPIVNGFPKYPAVQPAAGKTLGQVAYDGWAQGLPGCEWSNQTATQKRAWEKAAQAVLAESVANEHGEDLQMLLTAYRNLAASPAVQPAAGREALSKIIRQRLLGVAPDDQDVVLEDDDWRLILAALSAPQAAPGEGEQS